MNRKLTAIVLGGTIGATLDLSYAILFSWFRSGVSPMRLLQSVASGLLGANAFSGGVATAALGFGLHYVIALCAATAYVYAAGSLRNLTNRPVLCGATFGFLMFIFMNLIVLPLSQTHARTSFPPVPIITDLLSHMFLFGIPIALATRRAYVGRTDEEAARATIARTT
jgi:uncharacterized membrane protein YagU involved in acid resistance